MTPPHGRELERALRALVRELEEAAAGPSLDPLREVEFRLERPEEDEAEGAVEAWEIVATSTSGHGGESAHLLEDRVLVRLLGPGDGELRFGSTFEPGETKRVEWDGEGVGPLVEPARAFLERLLPPGVEDEAPDG